MDFFSRLASFLTTILLATATLGCASTHYRYFAVPSGPQRVTTSTHADILPITLPNGGGNVELASKGTVNLEARDHGKKVPAIHVRMRLVNRSLDTPWTVNAYDQKVVFADGAQWGPAFVASDAAHLPTIKIQPGEARSLDLFYPLPKGERTKKTLDGFDLAWTVRAGNQKVVETTPFVRQKVNERMSLTLPNMPEGHDFEYGTAFGPNWWYMSNYPDHSMLDIVPIANR